MTFSAYLLFSMSLYFSLLCSVPLNRIYQVLLDLQVGYRLYNHHQFKTLGWIFYSMNKRFSFYDVTIENCLDNNRDYSSLSVSFYP